MTEGIAAAAPRSHRRLGDPALCGSHPLVTPYYSRLGDFFQYQSTEGKNATKVNPEKANNKNTATQQTETNTKKNRKWGAISSALPVMLVGSFDL